MGLMLWMCSRLSWREARAPPSLALLWCHSSKRRFQAKYGAPDPGFSHLQAVGTNYTVAFQLLQMLTQKLRMAKSQTGQEDQGNKGLPETSESSSMRHFPLTQNRHVPASSTAQKSRNDRVSGYMYQFVSYQRTGIQS